MVADNRVDIRYRLSEIRKQVKALQEFRIDEGFLASLGMTSWLSAASEAGLGCGVRVGDGESEMGVVSLGLGLGCAL